MKRNLTPVPQGVKENVISYLAKNLPQYEMVNVLRKSNHPDDDYLYMVIAKHITNDTYATWTSWNQSTKSLNNGHYGLEDIIMAYEVAVENYYRV